VRLALPEEIAMLLEIDVRHYTGIRDWRGRADSGIGLACVTATERATVGDDPFDHRWGDIHADGFSYSALRKISGMMSSPTTPGASPNRPAGLRFRAVTDPWIESWHHGR